MNCLGLHLLVEFNDVAPTLLADPLRLEEALREAARAGGAHILSGHFHHFGAHQGVTGVLLLRESHISLHTWPEFRYAAIDIFMCGDCRPESAVEILTDALDPGAVRHHTIKRGPTAGKSARPPA